MKKSYISDLSLSLHKNERGIFMPIALLFFSVIFIISIYSIGKMVQEVNYHKYQTDWLKISYLGDTGTKAAISMLGDGGIPETKGEWVYYNGSIAYHLKPLENELYEISLDIQTDHTVRQETITYSTEAKKVVK
jgi:hypothetical protein